MEKKIQLKLALSEPEIHFVRALLTDIKSFNMLQSHCFSEFIQMLVYIIELAKKFDFLIRIN